MTKCKSCNGTGEEKCWQCYGDGEVDDWDEEGNPIRKTCSICNGGGRKGLCYSCKGTGEARD